MKLKPVSFSFSTHAEAYACRALVKGIIEIISHWVNDKEILNNLNLILTEACANVVYHAYEDTGPVEIHIRLVPEQMIECSISDWGAGFTHCPLNLNKPIPLSPPEAESGRGLYIISNLSDAFAIFDDNGKNTLQAIVNIGSKSWVRSA